MEVYASEDRRHVVTWMERKKVDLHDLPAFRRAGCEVDTSIAGINSCVMLDHSVYFDNWQEARAHYRAVLRRRSTYCASLAVVVHDSE